MLPLAMILAGTGATVAGSDRTLDQARLPAKFDDLRAKGVRLFPQDGSGIVSADQIVVASAAVEATVRRHRRGRRARRAADEPGGAARQPVQREHAADRRGGHQRQIDRHRHDRLDPPRDRARSDGDERRGDEEFRPRRRALRQRAGRRRRAVRQRSRRERRIDRALPAEDRGAQQCEPRPQVARRAARAVRRLHRQGRDGGDQPRQ